MSSLSSSADTSAAPPGLRLTIAAMAAGFATFVNMWCTQAILPVLAASFHVPEAATNATVTAPLAATAMMAPLIGAVSDRFGRKRFIAGAALLLIIPTLLAACATSLAMLAACRFAQGLLLPFIFTVTVAYIGDELPGPAAARLVGLYTSGTILGGFSGRFIAGLVTSALGWRAAFLAIGLLTFSMALLIAVLLPREKNFRATAGWGQALRSFPDHLTNPKLLANYAIGFGVLFSLVSVFTFINFRLAGAPYGLGPAALGGVFVVYLGGVAISPVAGRLAASRGRRVVMLCAFGLNLAGLGLTLLQPLAAILAGLLLLCCGIFAQQTVATGYTSIAARAAKSTAVGLYVTCYYIGGACGGIIPAAAWHATGWQGCAGITGIVQLLMLGLALRLWRRRA